MRQAILHLLIVFAIGIVLNVFGNFIYTKFDLTEDNRYTLTEPSVQLLKDVDDAVYIRVLLDGEFPAGFKRLQKATRELLREMSSYNGYVEYTFENPNIGSVEEINKRREDLASFGINPVNLRLKDVEGNSEKLIYPFAIINYKGRESVINLLESQAPGQSDQLTLNNSVSLLEYKFMNQISKMSLEEMPTVAFTYGHGEIIDYAIRDLRNSLAGSFRIGRYHLDSNYQVPKIIDMLVVAKPTAPFSEKDKFKIDQFVMNGGKVIWLIDQLNAEMDSLRSLGNGREFYPSLKYDLNLEDQLFKYGVRINDDLVLDLRCSSIPQVVAEQGGRPQIEQYQWYYHPLVAPATNHPMVKNLNYVNLQFASSIDTVKTEYPLDKTVLLTTSENSRRQMHPVRISFDMLRYEPDPARFNDPLLPTAVLLEGSFSSLFKNRVSDEMSAGLAQLGTTFQEKSPFNRMLVVSDGDVTANPITNYETGDYLPLGFNRFDKNLYANKDFMQNAIEYMLDKNGIIAARAKDVKLRLLDKTRAQAEAGKWQLINVLAPLLFLALFGFIFIAVRRWKYA